MDIRALKAEITTDPLMLGYAGKPPTQVCALLNAKRAVDLGYRPLTWKEVLDALTKESVAKIVEVSQTTNAQGYEAAAKFYEYAMIDSIESKPGSPCCVVLEVLAGKAVISTAELAVLQTLARNVVQMTRAEQLGLGVVAEGNVIDALALEAAHG